MALTIAITDLLTDINLVSGGGDNYKILDRGAPSIGDGAYRELWHEPDRGEPRLIYLEDGDRIFSAEMMVEPDTAGDVDDVLNKIHTLKRWLHGAGAQAIQAEQRKPVRDIYLKIQLDGATNATLHRIKTAAIPNMNAVLNSVAILNDIAYGLEIELRLAPHGRAQHPLYVHNNLINPHFLDVSGDLPHGWNRINSGETLASAPGQRLIGTRAQQVTTTADAHGLESDAVTIPAHHLMIASVWLRITSGTVGVYVRTTGGTEIFSSGGLTAANVEANAEQSLVDRNGYTWHLIKVEQVAGELTADQQVTMAVESEGGGATWLMDGAQLMTIWATNFHETPGMDIAGVDSTIVRGWTVSDKLQWTQTIVNTDYFANDELNTSWQFTQLSGSGIGTFNEVSSRVFDAPRGNTYKASAWFKLTDYVTPDWEVDITLEIKDEAGNSIDSVTITETDQSNAAASATGDDAGTWYQLVVEGTNSLAGGVQIVITLDHEGNGGPASPEPTVHIDEVYLYETERFTFKNWMIFGEFIYNRNDRDATNPERINTIDFFNIPGDAPALLELDVFMNNVTSSNLRFWMSKFTDGKYPVVEHSYEAEDFDTTAGGGAWATVSGSFSGGDVARYTGDNGDTGHLTHTLVDSFSLFATYMRSFFSAPRRIYARAQASDVANTQIWAEIVTDLGTTVNVKKTLNANSTMEWVDLGPLDVHLSESGSLTYVPIDVEIHVQIDSGTSQTCRIDKVEYLPVGDDSVLFFESPTLTQRERFKVSGFEREVVRAGVGLPLPRRLGVWTIQPGNVMTRLVIGWTDTSNAHTLTEYIRVVAKVYPRTTGLLGTI